MGPTLNLRDARAETFEPHRGSTFWLGDDDSGLVLVEVSRLGVQGGAPRPEPFSLVFAGPTGLAQATYALDHPALGRVDLFLVPIGPGSDGRARYEAVFN